MNEIFGVAPTDAGAVALLVLVVLFILTGKLVPRRTHEDVIADRDKWQQAYFESERARGLEHEQTGELLQMARLGGDLLTALPRPGHADAGEVNASERMDQTPRARP